MTAGCTTGTFWAHFDSKDDAITAAFAVALDDLVQLSTELYGDEASGLGADPAPAPEQWAAETIDRLIGYFSSHALLYRLAISRLPEHQPIRQAFRDAEAHILREAREIFDGPTAAEDAAALTVFCQGLNNPMVLRSEPDGRLRGRLRLALLALIG